MVVKEAFRQKRFCRSFAGDALDDSGGISHIIAFGYACQSKVGGIGMGGGFDSVPERFREGKGNGIPCFSRKSQKLQDVFRQCKFHRSLRKSSFL